MNASLCQPLGRGFEYLSTWRSLSEAEGVCTKPGTYVIVPLRVVPGAFKVYWRAEE